MKEGILKFILVLTVCAAVVFSVIIHSEYNRYHIQIDPKNLRGYKLDKRSGKVWMIRGYRESLVYLVDREGEFAKSPKSSTDEGQKSEFDKWLHGDGKVK